MALNPQSFTVNVNGVARTVEADGNMPLLWALRDLLGLTGTKFGCGISQCGACTVLFDGSPVRSCQFPVAAVGGGEIITIEGLSTSRSHRVQKAWIEQQVPQCGYCQSGMILSVVALLSQNPNPTDAEIEAAVTNICACGTYPRVRAAIRMLTNSPTAAAEVEAAGAEATP